MGCMLGCMLGGQHPNYAHYRSSPLGNVEVFLQTQYRVLLGTLPVEVLCPWRYSARGGTLLFALSTSKRQTLGHGEKG